MGHQTKITESNGSPQAASRGLARDVGEFAHDVFILAELQAQLFAADVKEYSQRVLVPGLAVLIGATLGLACFPFALAALALWLVQAFELSYAMGFLLAALAGAMLSALLCVIGCVQIRKYTAILGHSKQELIRNLNWIKKVLERNRLTRGNRTDDSWRTKT